MICSQLVFNSYLQVFHEFCYTLDIKLKMDSKYLTDLRYNQTIIDFNLISRINQTFNYFLQVLPNLKICAKFDNYLTQKTV